MLIACASLCGATAKQLSPLVKRSGDGLEKVTMESAPQSAPSTAAAADGETVSIQIGVKLDNSRSQELMALIAITADAETPMIYQAETSFSSFYSLQVPPGKYDLIATIHGDENKSCVVLFYENQEYTSAGTVMIDAADVRYSTKIRHISPTGEKIVFPRKGVVANCTTGDFWMMLRHNEYGTAFADETATLSETMETIYTNVVPEKYSLVRMDVLTWKDSPIYSVIPLDMTKEQNGPTEDGWLTIRRDFAETPAFANYKKNQDPSEPLFTMTGYNVVADKISYGFVSIGTTTVSCDTKTVAYWAPEGYDGYYEFYPVLRDNLVAYSEASISSIPLRATPTGFETVGLNFIGDSSLAFAGQKRFDISNPRFSTLPEDAVLGNCVPLLVCIPGRNGGFTFAYAGRYGEDMNLNARNLTEDLSPSQIEALGGQTHELTVSCDDNVLCSSADDFTNWMEWPASGTIKAEISTHNVLIDGEMSGVNKAELTMDAADIMVPTITSLQVRDNDDTMTDRLPGTMNGFLEFTAGIFLISNNDYRYPVYSCIVPQEITVEYAPHGEDTFYPLDVKSYPEHSLMPGYGHCYRVDLAGITHESADKWYDLRFSLKDYYGASLVQTLSPGIRIDKIGYAASLESVSVTAPQDAAVYNLQGIRVAADAAHIDHLPEGVYICNGRKFIVR